MPDFRDPKRVNQAIRAWHWARKPLSSTVNILAFALYDLFSAAGTLRLTAAVVSRTHSC
jgi:hypothetical protein